MELSLTEDYVRRYAGTKSFGRGEEYMETGAVLRVEQIGATLLAEVEGSADEPYEVSISMAGRRLDATCTCPYDYGDWCKHIVAAALSAIRHPESVAAMAPLDEVLARLDREALCTLIVDVCRRDRAARNAIATSLRALAMLDDGVSGSSAVLPQAIDQARIRESVHYAAATVERAIEDFDESDPADALNEELAPILDGIGRLIEADRAPAALAALETLTVELLHGMERLEDYGCEVEETFHRIGHLWCQALMTAELSIDERSGWAGRLRRFRHEGSRFGAAVGLGAAALAAEQSRDHPPVAQVLSGPSSTLDVGSELSGAGLLIDARLDLLQRTNRLEEAARLAGAAGRSLRYLELLVRLGRSEEAAEASRRKLSNAYDVLHLARAILEAASPM